MSFEKCFIVFVIYVVCTSSALAEEKTIQQKSPQKIQPQQIQPPRKQPPQKIDPFLLDPVFQKMMQALQDAKQLKTEGLAKIQEVENKVTQSLQLLNSCPPPISGSMQPPNPCYLPCDTSVEPIYVSSSHCDYYDDNALAARESSKYHLNTVKIILSNVEMAFDFIAKTCFNVGLNDSDKSNLKSRLSSLLKDAQVEKGSFDKFIEDINNFIEGYKICIKNKDSKPPGKKEA